MHDLSVADALRPPSVVVLNLPLAEYSIGHELLLLARRNALLLLPLDEFIALDFWRQIFAIREAVWICSDRFSAWDRINRQSGIMWRFRWSEWKRQRWVRRLNSLLPADYALALAEFRNYLIAARPNVPSAGRHAVRVLYGDEENSNRSMGQPLILSLYRFALTLPREERPKCAWDYPFARALWMFFSQLEAEGSFRIENDREREEQAVYDEAKADSLKEKHDDEAAAPPVTADFPQEPGDDGGQA